jgi:hypothetical protein
VRGCRVVGRERAGTRAEQELVACPEERSAQRPEVG